jgi:hypothetical protein
LARNANAWLPVNRWALLADHRRHFGHARAAAATAATAIYVDDVYVDLPVVVNIYAVINIVDHSVVATVDVVDYIALVAINVAKIEILPRRATFFMVLRLVRLVRMMFRFRFGMLNLVAHACCPRRL